MKRTESERDRDAEDEFIDIINDDRPEKRFGAGEDSPIISELNLKDREFDRTLRGTRRLLKRGTRAQEEVKSELNSLQNVRNLLEETNKRLQEENKQIKNEMTRLRDNFREAEESSRASRASFTRLEEELQQLRLEREENSLNRAGVEELSGKVNTEINKQLGELREINSELQTLSNGFGELLPASKEKELYLQYLRDLLLEIEAANSAAFQTVPKSRIYNPLLKRDLGFVKDFVRSLESEVNATDASDPQYLPNLNRIFSRVNPG